MDPHQKHQRIASRLFRCVQGPFRLCVCTAPCQAALEALQNAFNEQPQQELKLPMAAIYYFPERGATDGINSPQHDSGPGGLAA